MGGMSGVPVVFAMALTWCAISSLGRLRTHCRVRNRLIVVCDTEASPRTHRLPSHQADDIGAMLAVPSSFVVVMRTTGVPQYMIAGVMTECISAMLSCDT